MNKFVYILLLPLITHAQDFISTNTFESKTSKGTVVIEFWAEWNKSNQVDFLPSLKDCDVYRVDIVKQSSIQKKFSITSVPTIVILNNGTEEQRFISNIMLQLNANKKKVQNSIDDITFSKFH